MRGICRAVAAACLAASFAALAGEQAPPAPKPVPDAGNDLDAAYLGPERAEKMNVHWPLGGDAAARFPCLVLVHGGGYGGGHKDSAGAGGFSAKLVARLVGEGFVVANINYLLAFNHPHDKRPHSMGILPRVQWDFDAAVRFLRANAARYRVDPGQIGAWGWSAGGWLITHAGFSDGADTMPVASAPGKRGRGLPKVLAPLDDPRPLHGAFSARVSALAFDFFKGVEFITPDDPAALTYVGAGGEGCPPVEPPPRSPLAEHFARAGVPLTEVPVRSRRPEPVVHVPNAQQKVRDEAGNEVTLEDRVIAWFKRQLVAERTTVSPEIRPFVRSFEGALDVALLAASPDAAVHFTADGREPTERSPRYERPVRLTESATVKAIAIRPGERPSRVAAAVFTRDGQGPPTITGPERLPPARVGHPLSAAFTCDAGDKPVFWAFNGSVPATFEIDPKTGVFAGTPDRAGSFVVHVHVAWKPGARADSRSFVLSVAPADQGLSENPRGAATPRILAASKKRGGGDAAESIVDDERHSSRGFSGRP